MYRGAKNDDLKLVTIAQHIRENHPEWEVVMEPFVFWKHDGTLDHIAEYVYKGNKQRYRHPDIAVLKDGTILFIIEIDGSIHDTKKVEQTERRNREYEFAGIPLEVINEQELIDDGRRSLLEEVDARCGKWEQHSTST